MKNVLKKLGFVNNNIYYSNMIQYKHKHIYVYTYEMSKKKPYVGWEKCEYSLCTDHDGPNSKENRHLLESMLRIVCGHLPKGLKFSHEKIK